MKIVLQILAYLIAGFLAYQIYESIRVPIRFEKEKTERFEKVVKRLKEIRSAELAYKEVNGSFTADWDSLIHFVETGKLPLVRRIGMLTDSMIDLGWDEKKAIAKGLIIRDTTFIPIIDTLFVAGFNPKQLRTVPGTDKDFHLGATILQTSSGVSIPLFQAAAHNNTILHDLKEEYGQEIINLNDKARTNKRYPGLKVGSLEEANNNAGNWE